MRRLRIVSGVITLVGLALGVTGCGGPGKGALEVVNHKATPWRFARGGVGGAGATLTSAYDGRLDVLWERDIKEKPQGPLTLANGALVLAGAKRKVFLISPDSGKTLAKYKNRSSPQSGGLLVDSLLYNSTSPPFNYLDCRGVVDGKVRWRSVILDIAAPLLIQDERLFALGGDGVAYCLDRFSGDLLWEKKLGGKMIAAPALEGSGDSAVLWVVNSYGWIGSFEAVSGKELLRRKVGESLVSAPAVQSDGTVYFSGQGGHAFALRRQPASATTAEVLSNLINPAEPLENEASPDSFVLAQFQLQSPSWSSPAIKGDYAVFVDNTGHVYCFDSPELDELLWQTALGGTLVASPIIVGDYVVVGLLTGQLYTLSLSTGEVVSSRLLESAIKYSPVSDGERIYVATQHKSLYCLGALNR